MRLSIVTSLYRSAPHLQEFHRRMSAAAQKVTADYEIILVNDGSPDDSQAIAEALCDADAHVKLIELSRNYGQHKAMMTGLAHAQGEWVFTLDSDLEEEPELLGSFYEEAIARDVDVVYGVQSARKGALFERVTGNVFYWLINKLSYHAVPKNLVTMRIMRQKYVRSLVQHRDQELFLAGLWVLTGFRQVPKEIKKLSISPTTYNLARKISAFVNAVTSFSSKPLVGIFYIGVFISLAASVAGVYLLVRRLFFGELLAGWASLMVSIWFLGGLSILALGVIGIYLSKIFMETKRRPYTVIRSVRGVVEAAHRESLDEAV